MAVHALFVTLATRQAAGRMRVWRALRAHGAATLRDGVYALPASAHHLRAFQAIADDVRRVGGQAEIYDLDGRDDAQRQRIVALFDRSADYATLIAAIDAADPADAKAVRALRRQLEALAAIDFFPGEARRQAEAALERLAQQAAGEPAASGGRIRRLNRRAYQGRVWATRQRLWVDRIASAWLIRRFIDPAARFVWLDTPARCPRNALGFDFDGAAFTHVADQVSFEVLMHSFGLETDAALRHIAAIVHQLDVGGVPVPEAAGVAAVLAGARDAAADDDALLAEGSRLFEHLYGHFAVAASA